jgi:hypothetical protein
MIERKSEVCDAYTYTYTLPTYILQTPPKPSTLCKPIHIALYYKLKADWKASKAPEILAWILTIRVHSFVDKTDLMEFE